MFSPNNDIAAIDAEKLNGRDFHLTGFVMLPIVNLVLHLLRRYRVWSAYRAAYAELAGLDDRTLAEIKVSRADIPAIARRTALAGA